MESFGELNKKGVDEKQLVVSVDGSYTNEAVLKNLPERVTIIGRIRKDTKLYYPLKSTRCWQNGYGDKLPTPEQIRQSDQYSWQEVNAWAAGRT